MTLSVPRREFLKSAGGVAAGGALLAATGGHSVAHAAPTPEIPFIPIFIFGTYDYVNSTELTAWTTGGVATAMTRTAGAVYTASPLHTFVGTLRVPADAKLLTVSAIVTGADSVTAELWAHDMSAGDYIGGTYLATKTSATPTGHVAITVPTSTTVPSDHQMEVRVTGLTAATPLVGLRYSYQPVSSGFYPITPTRVYDSRDTGQAGPMPSGSTRDVSVANATSWAGGALNVVPDGAYAVTYNLTCADAVTQGHLGIYPKGGTMKASAMNWFMTGEIVANGGVVTLGGDRQVTVQAGGGGSTNFILDITGYYI